MSILSQSLSCDSLLLSTVLCGCIEIWTIDLIIKTFERANLGSGNFVFFINWQNKLKLGKTNQHINQ